jgi:hypothetical protein
MTCRDTPRDDRRKEMILVDLQQSMAKYPNVRPGQDFDGYD